MSEQISNETVIDEKPLVTFALIAYNQEKYIREAVEGAFSQTYSSLQIILSDDCSPDRTFEIMEEMAKNYRGRHKIFLNKNAVNLGITGHINKVGKICSGSYVVLAAGDDVSLPERTDELLKLCVESNALIAFSEFNILCENSKTNNLNFVLKENFEVIKIYTPEKLKDGFFLGPSYIIKKDIFSAFPEILPGVHHEDILFPIRAKLLGGNIAYTSKKLINYNSESGVTFKLQSKIKDDWISALKVINVRSFAMTNQILIDSNKIGVPVSYLMENRLASFLLELNFIEKRWIKFLTLNFFSINLWKYKIHLIKKLKL